MQHSLLQPLIENHVKEFQKIRTFKWPDGYTQMHDEYSRLAEKLEKAVKQLDAAIVEQEIIDYIAINLESGEWENHKQWICAIYYCPSSRYMEHLLNILKTEDKETLHYWVFDVIKYMKPELSYPWLPELKKLADPINPTWGYCVIETYFETLAWMDEEAEAFFLTLANSPNDKVAYRVNYWLETYEADRKEDEEDE